MEKYRPKGGKIFGGVFLLALSCFIIWFIVEGFLIYTPFAGYLSFRGIGGNYIKGRVTEILTYPDGDAYRVTAEYKIGFQRHEADLPAYIFYYEGLEVGDSIAVPYSQKSFEDMRREDKMVLSASLIVLAIFLMSGIKLLASEISSSRYIRKLILNKSYIYAHFEKDEYVENKVRAVCRYNNHSFKSKLYSKERYPFQHGGDIKVYVDLLKNPQKYLISEN